MDANGQRFHLLGRASHWRFETPGALRYDAARGTLALRSRASLGFDEAEALGEARLGVAPAAFSTLHGLARLDADGTRVLLEGAPLAGANELVGVTDLHFGPSGALFVLGSEGLLAVHAGGLWPARRVTSAQLVPFRAAPRSASDARLVVLDRRARRLAVLEGALPPRADAPLRLEQLPAAFAPDEDPVALATPPSGDSLVLIWRARDAGVRRLTGAGTLGPFVPLEGLLRPFAVTFADSETLLVAAPTLAGASIVTYPAPHPDRAVLHPLVSRRGSALYAGGPFVHGDDGVVRVLEHAPQPGADPVPAELGQLSHEAPEAAALARLGRVPWARDGVGTFAYLAGESIRAGGAGPGTRVIASDVGEATDLAVGHDGVLYVALPAGVRLIDLRGRWDSITLSLPDFSPTRLAACAREGVFVLDRDGRRLARVEGAPLPLLGPRSRAGDVFRPRPENPREPRLIALDAAIVDEETPVAIASNAEGRAVLLCWASAGRALVRVLDAQGRLGEARWLAGVRRPYTLGFLDAHTLVVLTVSDTPAEQGSEAVTYPLEPAGGTDTLIPLGGFYPLGRHDGGPLVNGLAPPAHYVSLSESGAGVNADEPPGEPRPLRSLRVPELAHVGVALDERPLDSGHAATVWHRAYVEAIVPRECGFRLELAATEEPSRPPAEAFFPHVFGEASADPSTPRGVWSPLASELPHHPGLLPVPLEPHRAGLFDVLIQRNGPDARRSRALSGRYLWVRIELLGNGRATPELAALRFYAPRFSYAQRYLPALYHEQLSPPDSDERSPEPTPHDFLERFLSNFEGILTTIEDRIAHAHVLTDPLATSESALGWLSQWVGFVFEPGYPVAQRRRGLAAAMELNRWRGTLRGLRLALDVATGDMASRGEIVLVEAFRLRRTFATILGADLADEDDPLLAGIVRSGNSYVGDTLFLGDEQRREFLAVFRELLPEAAARAARGEATTAEIVRLSAEALADARAVAEFLERFANRLTVLVHEDVAPERLRLIERVLELEAPCALELEVVRATHPFIVGLASLVGVDTFLASRPAAPGVRIDETELGRQSFLIRPASLDPRLEGGSA